MRYLLTQLLMEEGDLPSEALAPALEALKAANLPLDAPAGDGGGLETEYSLNLRAHIPGDTAPARHPVAAPIREYKCAAARAHGAASLRAQPQQPEPGGGPRLSGACRRNPPAHTRRAALA